MPTSPEENKAVVVRFFEAANTANMDILDEIMTEDFTTHGPVMFPFARGREVHKEGIMGFKNAFPDATLTVVKIFGEKDKVVAHVHVSATHTKEFMGRPPTGNTITWTASSITRFNDQGRMAERWVIEDFLGMFQQLGVMPLFS